MPDKEQRHHPWCNFFMGPRDQCKMCDDLFKRYPLDDGKAAADLITEHFPNVIIR